MRSFFAYSYCCVSFAWKLCGCAVRHVVLLSFSFGFHFGICKSYTHFQVQCASKSLSWCAVCVCGFHYFQFIRAHGFDQMKMVTAPHQFNPHIFLSCTRKRTKKTIHFIVSHNWWTRTKRKKQNRWAFKFLFCCPFFVILLGEKKVNGKIQSTFFLLLSLCVSLNRNRNSSNSTALIFNQPYFHFIFFLLHVNHTHLT